jgi:hypothetical protein
MADQKAAAEDYSQQQHVALSTWDDEGGAGPRGSQEYKTTGNGRAATGEH